MAMIGTIHQSVVILASLFCISVPQEQTNRSSKLRIVEKMPTRSSTSTKTSDDKHRDFFFKAYEAAHPSPPGPKALQNIT